MAQIVRLDYAGLTNVRALDGELERLLTDPAFDGDKGLLVQLGDGELLAPPLAVGVAESFANRRAHLRGRIAVHAKGESGYLAVRFIAMVGRYQGLRMEAFREVEWAVHWLTDGASPESPFSRRRRALG